MGQNSSKLETRSSKPDDTERTPKETKSIVLLGTRKDNNHKTNFNSFKH
jgi:hypothetical protein